MNIFLKFIFLFLMMTRISIGGHPFDIYWATSPGEQARGLMYVKEMAENDGMIFPQSREDAPAFWMKNTFIPLDLIFVGKEKEVTHIIKNTEPHSLKTLIGPERTDYVIEINGGVSDKLGIAIGDRVEF